MPSLHKRKERALRRMLDSVGMTPCIAVSDRHTASIAEPFDSPTPLTGEGLVPAALLLHQDLIVVHNANRCHVEAVKLLHLARRRLKIQSMQLQAGPVAGLTVLLTLGVRRIYATTPCMPKIGKLLDAIGLPENLLPKAAEVAENLWKIELKRSVKPMMMEFASLNALALTLHAAEFLTPDESP